MIHIEQLQVKYDDFIALSIDDPITIAKGDRIGVIGSNGAGKTTFIKAILGLVGYSGKIQSDIAFNDMSVHMQENDYVKTVPVRYIIQAVLNTDIQKNNQLRELIDFFEFSSCLNKKYQNLSGGQKQRLTIILVLMQNAPITFFDEVTSGLDFETRKKLMSKIVEWYQGNENSLCIISHYYDELDALTDKLLILEKGHVVAFGKTSDLFEQYCGKAVIIADNNEKNRSLTETLPRVAAPEHLLAFPCNDKEDEIRVVTELSRNNVNYKRSSNDIEILFANAVKQARESGIKQ
jgi:ABC-2 type transport system ATP-binding protein